MKIIDLELDNFTFDKDILNQRIRGKITRNEYIGLLIALGFAFIFAWNLYHYQIGAVDLIYSYLPAGRGDFSEFRYPYWIVPVFQILENIPLIYSYGIWMVLNIMGVFFATRIFGGKPILVLSSYQLLYALYYGQITGILVFGLAIAWWGVANNKWHLAGAGLLIAATKPQVGVIMGLLLLLFAEISWRERFKTLIVPVVTLLGSLFFWPRWPQELVLVLINNPLNTNGDLSLWQWIGFWSLLLYIPVFLIPIKGNQKLILIFVTFLLTFPYFQHTGLIILYCFPLGWLPILGYIGLLLLTLEWTALKLIVIMPLVLYLYLLIQQFRINSDINGHPLIGKIMNLFSK
jgi:hypothetical protein